MVMTVIACAPTGPQRHEDGGGPIAWTGAPSSFTVGIDLSAYPQGTDFSFGAMVLCRSEEGVATIMAVRPTEEIGQGARYLGALVRDVDDPEDMPVISSAGFPPEGTNHIAWQPAEDSDVEVACGSGRGVELLIGFQNVGGLGGGWTGVDLHYRVDAEEYIFEIENLMVLCPEHQGCSSYIEDLSG